MGHHRLKAAAGASPADPYFSSTSLLLLGNGTNGGQNNTFVDSSTNNFTITRNGNTTQGSFSPFSAPDGRWSNYFDGSGDYLTVPDNTALDLGSSDFTIECWFYPTGGAGTYRAMAAKSDRDTAGGEGTFVIQLSPTEKVGMFFSTGGSGWDIEQIGSTSVSSNTWNHVAATRSGNTFRLFLNGNLEATATSTITLSNNSEVMTVGCLGYTSGSFVSLFYGYISNLRVLKGTAQYTATFTPPTSPLTAITNTSLLTCQSNRFKDNSSNAFAITPSGNAAVTSFSPFAPLAEYSASSNGGSGYFDGSGDYLSGPTNDAFKPGTGDFTVEAWVYPTGGGSNSPAIFDCRISGNEAGGFILNLNTSYQPAFYTNTLLLTGSTALSLNAWSHLAITRSSTTVTLWLNGASVGTLTNSTNFNTGGCYVGMAYTGTNNPFMGNISSLRVLKNTAQYTSTFTPPTSPLTAITNTSLLLNFTNASILDSTAKNDLETVGDAQISTSVKKFGTGSLKFDGTGDQLLGNTSASFAFGTGDFTIEAWVYQTQRNSLSDIASCHSYAVGADWLWSVNSSGYLYFQISSSNSGAQTSSSAISLNTWTHIAISRSSGTVKQFIDGTQVSSATYSTSISNTIRISIGSAANLNSNSTFYGYIDDLRITKGVARYTSNFTPPSAQLPAR